MSKPDPITDYISNLSEDQKEAVDGFLDLMDGVANVEVALMEGEEMLQEKDLFSFQHDNDELETLLRHIAGYLRSFVLIGYDYSGRRMFMPFIKDNEQFDALKTLVENSSLDFFDRDYSISYEDDDEDWKD